MWLCLIWREPCINANYIGPQNRQQTRAKKGEENGGEENSFRVFIPVHYHMMAIWKGGNYAVSDPRTFSINALMLNETFVHFVMGKIMKLIENIIC